MKNLTKKDFLNDLYLFYRLFIASNYKDDVPAPHIKELSRKLMNLRNGVGKSRIAVSMPPRHKLADSTPVLTYNKGWITHGDLEIGDYVFGLNGEPTKIIDVSEKEVCDRLITFTDGSKILAHEGHLWSVYRRGNDKLQIVSTKDMEDNFSYVEKNGKKRYRFQLPLMSPLQYTEKKLPIDPYWLGYWLGDGTYNKPCITHDKQDSYFIDVVPYEVSSQSIHKDTGVYTTYFSNDNLIDKLKDLNLFENKHIPVLYKESSFEQRLQLLAGLIDSDGSVDKNGRVRFINTNKKLIDDVIELCNGLGLYPYLMHYSPDKINEYKKNSVSLPIVSKKDCYHIGFQPRFKIPTTIPRKKIDERGLRRRLSITNIEKVDNGELGKCIEVEAEDGIYLVGNNLIPTHNSKSSMVTLAFPLWLIFQNPDVHIMIVTGSPKLSDKFGIQLREYVRDLGPYFNVYLSDVKQASTHLMFCDVNKKLYKGNLILASSGGGITGQDADYLIVDDPYRGNDDEFTPSALQKKIDWANRVIEQRIEPHTKYCILHTRWHPISKTCPVKTTNRGWVTHGDLKVGDYVLTPHGKDTMVTKVHPTVMVDNCFEFSNGDKVVSGDYHLWKFHDDRTNTVRLFETHEIMNSELFIPNSYVSNFKIPYKNKLISLIDKYKVEPVEGNCITVEAEDGMYLVGKNLTPTHNSRDLIGYYKEEDPDSYDFIEFPALDENEEPLWKERYSREELLKKKKVVGERVFQSVYQQQPIDATSDFFNMQRLKFGLPDGFDEQSVCRAWDIASSDALSSSNDFTAGAKLQRYDDYCVISDLVHGRFGGRTKNIVQETAMSDTPTCHVVIETGVAAAGELLYQEWKNQLQGFIVHQAKVGGQGKSKIDRATPFKNAVEDGKVFINISNPELRQLMIDELNSFPNGAHDDITDAISHGYNHLFMNEDVNKKATAKMRVIHI